MLRYGAKVGFYAMQKLKPNSSMCSYKPLHYARCTDVDEPFEAVDFMFESRGELLVLASLTGMMVKSTLADDKPNCFSPENTMLTK